MLSTTSAKFREQTEIYDYPSFVTNCLVRIRCFFQSIRFSTTPFLRGCVQYPVMTYLSDSCCVFHSVPAASAVAWSCGPGLLPDQVSGKFLCYRFENGDKITSGSALRCSASRCVAMRSVVGCLPSRPYSFTRGRCTERAMSNLIYSRRLGVAVGNFATPEINEGIENTFCIFRYF